MKETNGSKLTPLFDFIKKHKKRICIVSIAAAVVILLLLLLLLLPVFSPKRQNPAPAEDTTPAQTEEDSAEETEAETETDAGTTEAQTQAETEPPTVSEEPTVDPEPPAPSLQVPAESVQVTGYDPLDQQLQRILSGITYAGMSSNEKLYAIYQYVKGNMVYNMFPPAEDGLYDRLLAIGYSDYDSSQMTLAYNAAVYKEGVCDNYAALTMLLARAAGIPLTQSGGLSAAGSSHAWNILTVNGERFLVDTNYGIFLQRFSESGFTEQMDGSLYFNHFHTYVPPVEEKKISWMFNAGFGNQRFYGNNRGEITQDATINRAMYPSQGSIYPEPITPMVTMEGTSNTFTATVSSNGTVLETLTGQSGDKQMYYFSWYPPNPGSYVVEITAQSDGILTAHFRIYADITG